MRQSMSGQQKIVHSVLFVNPETFDHKLGWWFVQSTCRIRSVYYWGCCTLLSSELLPFSSGFHYLNPVQFWISLVLSSEPRQSASASGFHALQPCQASELSKGHLWSICMKLNWWSVRKGHSHGSCRGERNSSSRECPWCFHFKHPLLGQVDRLKAMEKEVEKWLISKEWQDKKKQLFNKSLSFYGVFLII